MGALAGFARSGASGSIASGSVPEQRSCDGTGANGASVAGALARALVSAGVGSSDTEARHFSTASRDAPHAWGRISTPVDALQVAPAGVRSRTHAAYASI